MSKLEIELLEAKDIPEAVAVFECAYSSMNVPSDEQAWFESDLKNSFHPKDSKMTFYKIQAGSKLISFAALEALTFSRGAWSLRWGTTLPEYQRQGIMSRLTEYRVEQAKAKTSTIGSIHVMARSPNIYLNLGFERLYERGPENRATYLIKVIHPELGV